MNESVTAEWFRDVRDYLSRLEFEPLYRRFHTPTCYDRDQSWVGPTRAGEAVEAERHQDQVEP